MTNNIMNEKEMFLNSYEKEFETTLEFLNAYPADKLDFRPKPQLQSAIELAWYFPEEDRILISGALDGEVILNKNPLPASLDKIKEIYESSHRALLGRIKELPDVGFNEMITFGSGAGNAVSMRRGDALWLAVMDAVHHRGQFSLYIKMAGGKVPPIYTASDEEPVK